MHQRRVETIHVTVESRLSRSEPDPVAIVAKKPAAQRAQRWSRRDVGHDRNVVELEKLVDSAMLLWPSA